MITEKNPELANYKISYADDGPTESLTQKLAQIYADRPLRPFDNYEEGEWTWGSLFGR